MNWKALAKELLPVLLVDAVRRANTRRTLQRYLNAGRVPWSSGYTAYWEQVIVKALADDALLNAFRTSCALPDGYGVGIDERCVEYPWLMANMTDERQLLLDAGSTLNYDFLLRLPALRRKVLHIITLAPEANCFWQRGVSYIYHDLRDIPIRDSFYDAITCLSTLEHVGCNNVYFTHEDSQREDHPGQFTRVMEELRRVLKPGGTLWLTVPFGIYQHLGMSQQFDLRLLSRAISSFGPVTNVTTHFYRYTRDGWNVSSADDSANSRYVEWVTRVWQGSPWPDPIPVESDLAAAARAVACVQLTKK